MRARVTAAAVDGLVFGVKWGIAVLVIALLNFAWAGDYRQTRQEAHAGQLMFDSVASGELLRVLTKQQASAPAPTK